MVELLASLQRLATFVFAVSSMLAVGLSYTLLDILEPLRSARRVFRALLANFVLVPLLAYLILRLLALEEPMAVGLMLVATAAGAPFLIKLSTAADTDLGLSATLLVLLLPTTVVYMPFVVPAVIPGATVSAGAIALPLILGMLLPLLLGLLVKAKAPVWAYRLQPWMGRTSSYALVALIGFTVLANLQDLLDVTMRAIVAALLVVSGAFAMGYLLGGRNPDAREVLGLGTGQRNIAAATVVATQGFGDPDILIMVIVTALVGLAVLFPIASKLRQWGARRAAVAAAHAAASASASMQTWTSR